MRRLIRANMAEGTVNIEDLTGAYAEFGGRGLTSHIVAREVPPLCHPLSALNKLVIAPGLLSGTTCANSGRLSVGAKSPLAGTIKESNVGGNAAHKLGRLRIAGIVAEDKAPEGKLYYMVVNKDCATMHPADDLKSLNNYELCERLIAKHGEKVAVISIGSAGEMKLSGASVAVTDTMGLPSRHTFRPHSSLNYRPPAPEAIFTTWIVHSDRGDPLPLPGGKDTLPLT